MFCAVEQHLNNWKLVARAHSLPRIPLSQSYGLFLSSWHYQLVFRLDPPGFITDAQLEYLIIVLRPLVYFWIFATSMCVAYFTKFGLQADPIISSRSWASNFQPSHLWFRYSFSLTSRNPSVFLKNLTQWSDAWTQPPPDYQQASA